ncbi:synaptonemal complex protein 3-like [Lutra lutra]|uniref:synaptonemal complex protein 3-like n=1 Tax=Lutra lutra TaxID=9657 RepID=UPI001FD3B228|nr:synaptonemal complex protein 3-like [Lutra lutra]XP_047572804.1 synaptonemal complex protein 3-like [Lutra lutra]
MPPAGRKRLGRAAKAPVEAQSMAAYDFGRQERRQLSGPEVEGNNPVTDNYWGRSPPAGSFLADLGNELQNMLERFEGDTKRIFYAKRKRCMMDTRASVKSINQKIEHVWKTQEEQRQKLYHKYCQQFLTLFQEWDTDAQKTKEEEEKLANIFRQQQKVLQRSRIVQSQRMQGIKELYEQFLKSKEDLEKNQENFLIGEQSELGKEMVVLQNHLMMAHQQQEVATVRKSLQSLLF